MLIAVLRDIARTLSQAVKARSYRSKIRKAALHVDSEACRFDCFAFGVGVAASQSIGIGGTGYPASPATPPYMRVRIRRFGGLS